jgi:hypothetical protein
MITLFRRRGVTFGARGSAASEWAWRLDDDLGSSGVTHRRIVAPTGPSRGTPSDHFRYIIRDLRFDARLAYLVCPSLFEANG